MMQKQELAAPALTWFQIKNMLKSNAVRRDQLSEL